MSSFERMSCCKNFKIFNISILYHKLLLEEEENVLRETLRNTAKEELTEEIKKIISEKRWDQYANVIKELIEKETAPEEVKNLHLLAPCSASCVLSLGLSGFLSFI